MLLLPVWCMDWFESNLLFSPLLYTPVFRSPEKLENAKIEGKRKNIMGMRAKREGGACTECLKSDEACDGRRRFCGPQNLSSYPYSGNNVT
jgi:hypothetical protein